MNSEFPCDSLYRFEYGQKIFFDGFINGNLK